MRTLALLGLLGTIGCTGFGKRAQAPTPVGRTDDTAASARFFDYWNANARRIDSVRCDHVDIDGKSGNQIYPMVTARMAIQEPNNFRLTGTVMGKTEVDLGSNSEEVWSWIARESPPAVYFCNRRDLQDVKSSMLVDPDWVGEVFGVKPLDPGKYRVGNTAPEYFTLISDESVPGGRTLFKRLVVNRKSNRIAAFELFDGNHSLLAEIRVLEYHEDRKSGLFIPRKIRMELPRNKTWLTLAMRPRKLHFNAVTPELAQSVFRRGEYSGTQEIDLAARFGRPSPRRQASNFPPEPRNGRGRLDPQVQRTGGPVQLLPNIETIPSGGTTLTPLRPRGIAP